MNLKELPAQSRFDIGEDSTIEGVSSVVVFEDGRTVGDVLGQELKFLEGLYSLISKRANWPINYIPTGNDLLVIAVLGYLANECRKMKDPGYDPGYLFRRPFSSKVKKTIE